MRLQYRAAVEQRALNIGGLLYKALLPPCLRHKTGRKKLHSSIEDLSFIETRKNVDTSSLCAEGVLLLHGFEASSLEARDHRCSHMQKMSLKKTSPPSAGLMIPSPGMERGMARGRAHKGSTP